MRISRAALLLLVSLAGCRARGCDRTNGIAADDAPAAPAPDLVEACVEGARVHCRATEECEPGAALTVDGLRACSDAYAKLPCDERDDEPEACTFRGTLAVRAACAFSAQCASGSCALERDEACGRCAEEKLQKKGGPCEVRFD